MTKSVSLMGPLVSIRSISMSRQEMFPGPQEPAPEVPGTGNHVGKVFHGVSCG